MSDGCRPASQLVFDRCVQVWQREEYIFRKDEDEVSDMAAADVPSLYQSNPRRRISLKAAVHAQQCKLAVSLTLALHLLASMHCTA